MSKITYLPLSREEQDIRLILLEDKATSGRTGGSTASPLKCQFLIQSLKSYPKHKQGAVKHKSVSAVIQQYYALSYVWGDPSPVRDIYIDGQLARISCNLDEALHSILRNTNHRVIWADALSINQEDKREKSWQVQMMGNVYARADAVLSWIGPDFPNSALALSNLRRLNGAIQRHGYVCRSRDLVHRWQPPQVEKVLVSIVTNADCWDAMVSLSKLPYWSRVWILQELAVARSRLFLCADTVTKNVDSVLTFLFTWQHENCLTHEASPFDRRCWSMLSALKSTKQYEIAHREFDYMPPSLSGLLIESTQLQATDVRDKVYALLNLAKDLQDLGIYPDYTKEASTVLRDAAVLLIQRRQCIEPMIDHAMGGRTLQNMPSWVPDWSSSNTMRQRYGSYNAHQNKLQPTLLFDSIHKDSDPECIKLYGHVVSTIQIIGESCPEHALTELQTSSAPTFGMWLESTETKIWTGNGHQTSPWGTSSAEADRQSLIVELLSAGSTEYSPISSQYPHHKDHHRIYDDLKRAVSLQNLWSDLDNVSESERDLSLLGCVKRLQNTLGSGARPFRTASGYLGLAPHEKCQEGDTIVILLGVDIPCVLRRCTQDVTHEDHRTKMEKYQLVGQVYIEGLMWGQFFRKWPRPRRQRFRLC